ncbi:ABC transporter permease [Nakamurella antarctica]|uniref:ABC transporter permease n=1 Tax=Nakamurella antarctica TaxID=1902245 RepID=UPI0019CF737D|nr:FtsX-like permease family protein [Nakamurella antarctica]
MIILWMQGLLRRRPGRLLSAAAGISVAVALLASLGAFLAHSQATMTDRAVRGVGIDWQVQIQPGTDPTMIADAVRGTAGITGSATVGFGASSGLSSTTGTSTQTTGAAVVLGIPTEYRALFPTEIRTLAGAETGVLLAQQTAANLHAAPGDSITLGRTGLAPVTVTVDGIVDLPQADSLFRKIGAPAGAQRTAPPDNVLLVPTSVWHKIFDSLATARPDLVTTQIHVQLAHQLPADPAAAYTDVTAAAHNFEATTTGGATVGNNLGAALDAARADAAYALALFGFLGLPGAVLAALLTATIASSAATRRRSEQALLRTRGASAAQLTRLAGAEALATGLLGSALGLTGAALVGQIAFGTASFGTTSSAAVIWAGASAAAGMAIAAATILVPARRDLRRATVSSGRATIAAQVYPTWARYGLDAILLIMAGLVFTATSGTNYQLVLAPKASPPLRCLIGRLLDPRSCGSALVCSSGDWRIFCSDVAGRCCSCSFAL